MLSRICSSILECDYWAHFDLVIIETLLFFEYINYHDYQKKYKTFRFKSGIDQIFPMES